MREGYTCDCFDGYEFDLSKMACIGELATMVSDLITRPRETPTVPTYFTFESLWSRRRAVTRNSKTLNSPQSSIK